MLKKQSMLFLSLLFGLGLSLPIHAATNIDVCAKYQRADSSWSHGYKVKAIKVSGSELNEAINSDDFNSYDDFLIIPWKEGGGIPFSNLIVVMNHIPMNRNIKTNAQSIGKLKKVGIGVLSFITN